MKLENNYQNEFYVFSSIYLIICVDLWRAVIKAEFAQKSIISLLVFEIIRAEKTNLIYATVAIGKDNFESFCINQFNQ